MSNKYKKLIESGDNLIGYWGFPERSVIEKYKKKYGSKFIDLDEDLGFPDVNIIPEAFCQIITNIINNAIALRNRIKVILAAVGEDKCDNGRYAAKILKDMGYNVVESRNENNKLNRKLKISVSSLPLVEKVERIMDTVIEDDHREYKYTKPTHGFWGVPPNDFKILEIFPDTTHVYGWTRCVEAGKPADLDLEMKVDENIPIVFYTQAFCGKQQIAKYLAEKYRGMFLDADKYATTSIISKIEAFLKLG